MNRWKRALRTGSSERLVAFRGTRAVGTVDLHFLNDGRVAGTVVLDASAGWTEEQIPDLLASLNEEMLPGVDQSRGTLAFTVVVGELVGYQEPEPGGESSARETAKGGRILQRVRGRTKPT